MCDVMFFLFFFFSSRRRHTRLVSDWSSDVCSSDLTDSWEENIDERHPHALPPARPVARRRGRILSRPWHEIGRASCRGKSVDLGGRRIFKKKEKTRKGGTKCTDTSEV